MLKVGAFLIVLLMTSMLGMWVGGRTGVKKSGEVKPDKIQIILYSQGKITYLDEHSLYFKDVLAESKSLFLTADTSYRLIMSEDRIKEIKERQTVLEVKFSEIQTGDVLNGHKVHFTKLLVPLSGQFSNGTVFFAGIWDRLLGGKELKYSSLQDYGSTNFVRNTRGLDHLKGKLQKMSIMID